MGVGRWCGLLGDFSTSDLSAVAPLGSKVEASDPRAPNPSGIETPYAPDAPYFGCQFWMSVIGVVAGLSSTLLIKKRPSRVTS